MSPHRPPARAATTAGEPATDLAGRLAAEGLTLRRPPDLDAVEWAERLARALAPLGAVPRAFAHHLAARLDLLPPDAALRLLEVPAGVEPLPAPVIWSRLVEALGAAPREIFAELDPSPVAVTPFRQVHRAHTRAGEAVELVVARSEAAAALEPARLEPLVAALDAADLPGEEVVEELRRTAETALDLAAEAEVLERMLEDGERFPALAVPRVDGELSRGGLLVREDLGGVQATEAVYNAGTGSAALRRLALVWLRQVTLGRGFPLLADGPEVRWLRDGRVAFVGGPFAALPGASRSNLWSYLSAASESDPTAACERLLAELTRRRRSASEADLLLRLRQVVPFRDGTLGEGADPLADQLFAAFRVAEGCGFRLRRPGLDFARGLARLAVVAREAAPGEAPLAAALEELRLQRSAGELRGILDPADLAAIPAPYAAALLEMPRKLDRALDLLARGEARVRLEVAAPRARGGAMRRVVAVGAGAGAVLLAAPRLLEALQGAGAADWALVALLAALLAGSLWR